MKCKKCEGGIKLVISCRTVTLNCMDCGKVFSVKEYIDEMDEEMLERISLRPCDRV
jgi:hypothetical protein